jgi:type IX secretion system PorP/SprF family membrane protein
MKRLVLFLLASVSAVSRAQDIHFSQTSQTPLLINPGAAGVYDGWERVLVNHRNQWLGAGTQFMTTAIAADANFGKSSMNDKAHMGIGLMFFNDIGGDSRFGNQSGSITLSGILPMGGSGHSLSAGIQGGYGNRTANFSNLDFSSQWNGTSFDRTIVSGEANSTSFRYVDASAGLYYVFDGGKSNFRRNEDFKLQLGVGGFHLNRPQLKYATVNGDRLYSKWVLHAGVVSDLANTNWAIDASIVQFIQGPHKETIFGTVFRYRMNNGTKITGLKQEAYIGFGAFYRLRDALVPTVSVDWRGFRFGVSYDYTVSTMRKAYTGGSLEFSLSYTNLSNALFKTRNRF